MENFLQIDPITISSNMAYLALLIGLWTGVTAFYIPGTGLVEIIAVVMLIGITIMLTLVPTNWIAVLVMVSGVTGFLLLPFLKPEWSVFAELGLVLQAGGGYFLIEGQPVSLLLIAVTVALAWSYNRFILVPTLRARSVNVGYDDKDLVGSFGRVVAPITTATGTVHVNGELWTARSEEPLDSGTPIIVVDRQGLELQVEKAKREKRAKVSEEV